MEYGGNASTGDFERVVPRIYIYESNNLSGRDLSDDFGDQCYVTGNGGDGGQNDIDNGDVILESPSMDLSAYTTATATSQYISGWRWKRWPGK